MNLLATLWNGSLLPDVVATTGSGGVWGNFVWFVNTYPSVSFYIALALLLFVLLLLLRSRRARRDVRVYQDDGGYAVVSQRALRHLIYIACEDAGLASSPKICFREAKGRINVQVGIKLYQSQRLSDVHELLRKRIRAAVEQTHGIQVGEVSLKVLGFRKDAEPQEESHSQDEEQQVPVIVGEASAASLYEEPVTGETVADSAPDGDGVFMQESAESEAAKADAPRKSLFGGFFGRKKEPEADGLFVSEEQDGSAAGADSSSGSDSSSASGSNVASASGDATGTQGESDASQERKG